MTFAMCAMGWGWGLCPDHCSWRMYPRHTEVLFYPKVCGPLALLAHFICSSTLRGSLSPYLWGN